MGLASEGTDGLVQSADNDVPGQVRIRDFLSAHPGRCLGLAAGLLAAAGSLAFAVDLLRQGATATIQLELIAAGAGIAVAALLMLSWSLVRQVGHQKRLAANLEDNRRLLETTQRVAKIGSWSATFENGTGGTTRWSPEVFRIFGVAPAAWGGTVADFEALVHPDDRRGRERARLQAMQSGASNFGMDYRIWRPDGAIRWVQTQAEIIRDPAGQAAQMVGTLQDITERKEAEDALRHSEARLRDYAETASDWFWETGPDHRFIDMSTRIEAFVQRAPTRNVKLPSATAPH